MTDAAAETAPLPAAPARISLRDFSDRLSPMLVKELRQGLKSPVFAWGLIAMQLSLALISIVIMDDGTHRDVNTGFWWSLAGVICILLPMRVANALRDEMQGNTLDTLLLTRLSAWRITLGKWLATGALQMLVAVTALPYLILRYFAGGVNMPLEIAWLAIYVVFGMVTTAVMIGLSWFPYFLIRAVVMLAVLGGAAGFCGGTIDEISRNNRYELDKIYIEVGWPGVVFGLTLTAWAAFYFLDLGAAQLAPVSENRSTRRRLAALIVLIVAGSCCFGSFPDRDTAPIMALIVGMGMLLPAIQALCERPANYAPVLMPFVKRGVAGRLAGRVLYPGWHTGTIFALLILVTACAVAAAQFYRLIKSYTISGGAAYTVLPEWEEGVILLVITAGILGTIILPVVVWRVTRGMKHWDFWRWLLLLIIAAAFHFFATMLGIRASPRALYANYLLPSGGFLVLPAAEEITEMEWNARSRPRPDPSLSSAERNRLWERQWQERRESERRTREEHGIVAGVSLCVWLAAAGWLALREMRVTRQAERELM